MKDLSLHILDIMQNSTEAGASLIGVMIRAKVKNGLPPGPIGLSHDSGGMLEITIEDNGCGMDENLLASVTDPFTTTRTTRRVGLGIPLFKASAEQSGGSFRILSQKGIGTLVKAEYGMENVDRPPLGDVAGVITDMAAAYSGVEIQLNLENGNSIFSFSSREVQQRLGEVPLAEPEVLKWLREYIGEGIKEIFGGVLSEIIG